MADHLCVCTPLSILQVVGQSSLVSSSQLAVMFAACCAGFVDALLQSCIMAFIGVRMGDMFNTWTE